MTDYDIGPGQIKVLRVLWELKHATAQEITDILNSQEPTKLSTVQTFLRILMNKQLVDYNVEGRTYIFYPIVPQEEVRKHALSDFIDHMFAGSMSGFVSFIVKEKALPDEELERIKKLLEENGAT